MTSPVVPAVGHSFGRKNNTPVEAQPTEHKTARPVFESDLMGFRSAEPVSLFSMEVPTFVASQCIEETDEPIIRAQSPEGYQQTPVDPATPGYGDPILEGSPYRNQFQAIPPGWVDINVNAAEGRTGRLMFGAGVNSDAGVVGSFVWDESNFDLFRPPTSFADIIEGRAWRGGGQRFRAEAAPGNQVSRYAISWTDPYFMYTDYSFGVSGFYFNRYYPDWREDRVGGRISLGRQWTPEWSSGLALRLEEVEMRIRRFLRQPSLPKIWAQTFSPRFAEILPTILVTSLLCRVKVITLISPTNRHSTSLPTRVRKPNFVSILHCITALMAVVGKC
jgi:hypothetical protein